MGKKNEIQAGRESTTPSVHQLTKSPSHFFPIVIIILASIALYVNTLKNGFVYDDWIVIVENLQIRELDNVPKLIQKDYFYISGEGSYRPVVTFTYFVDYALFGLKPWGYHLTNIFLHAMNGALLYIFLTTFFRRGTPLSLPLQSHSMFTNRALLASLIFIVHPVLTEPINVISYREDLLAFFFFIASLILYIKSRTTLNKRFSIMMCLFSYLTYFLALLSKEMAITLPLIIYCCDWFNKKKRSLFEGYGIGYIVLTIIYLYLRLYYFYLPLEGNIPDWRGEDRFLTIPSLFLDYWKLTIFPYSLSAEYITSPSQSVFSKPFIISFIITCTLLVAVFFLIKKKKEEMVFGILFFCITLLPVYNIIAIPNPLAERYLYLPAVGFAIIVGSIFYDIFNAQNLKFKTQNLSVYMLYVLFFAIVCAHSLVVIKRNSVWSDDYTLWSDTINKTHSSQSHFNLARAYYDKALIDEAIKHYKISIKLDSANPKAYNNLGLIYANQGFLYEAMMLYKDALKLKPDMPLYHTNIANLYYKQGQLDDAIKHYLISLELKPDLITYYQVGILYIKQEKFNEAVKQFQKVLNLNPKFAEARSQMEYAFLKMGLKEAERRNRNLK